MTRWSCSIQLLCVPLPALLPARIIPAEHMATDVICLHKSRLLRMVEVCRTGCLDAGAAGPLHPPSNPRDPAAFPGAFCIPSLNWEPHSPRLIASSCSFFFWGGGLLNGITMCRGRSGVPGWATCRRRRFKAKPDPSRDAGRRGRPCVFPGSVSSCNLVKWSGSISPCFSLPSNS